MIQPDRTRKSRKIILSMMLVFLPPLKGQAEEKAYNIEEISTKIFPEKNKLIECAPVSRGQQSDLEKLDPKLQNFSNHLLKILNDTDETLLGTLFHPKLKNKENMGRRLFATLRNRYTKPWQFSIYRTYALKSDKGEKVTIPCTEDNIEITTLYGYPLQFTILIQMMSQNELSRIFAMVVPKDNEWFIGGFHIQQWTYLSKDFEQWAKAGVEKLDSKDNFSAYINFDLAQKMLFGGDFITYSIKDKILASRDEALPKEGFLKKIQDVTGNSNIVHAGTALAAAGPGILVREMTKKDYSTVELKILCNTSGKALLKAGIINDVVNNIQCDFILPGDRLTKPGELGGFSLTKKQLETEDKNTHK